MNEYNMERFLENCLQLNISLNEEQKIKLQKYYEILVQWNTFMNLTAITEYGDVLKKHFLDSLSLIKVADLGEEAKILDVGTGAGFPGIPLKIAFPHLQIVLLDSLGKRVKFLDHVIEELKLERINAIHGRAEDFARNMQYRESFDYVVSRAVANLSSLSEYCIPYVKTGGYFVSYKSGNVDIELQESRNAIKILGGAVENIVRFTLADTEERTFICIKKIRKTEDKYPRKAGIPSRNPL